MLSIHIVLKDSKNREQMESRIQNYINAYVLYKVAVQRETQFKLVELIRSLAHHIQHVEFAQLYMSLHQFSNAYRCELNTSELMHSIQYVLTQMRSENARPVLNECLLPELSNIVQQYVLQAKNEQLENLMVQLHVNSNASELSANEVAQLEKLLF